MNDSSYQPRSQYRQHGSGYDRGYQVTYVLDCSGPHIFWSSYLTSFAIHVPVFASLFPFFLLVTTKVGEGADQGGCGHEDR